ncbi:hypothetical protein [Polycyclovorans algicola]|uniref:hypothetical protein n=1 Tax=Polycyclovorans algicola TaxID=616992 RepID=UPI00137757A0|nr:hypothetical protein [Polycyclovorans algicola]
MPPAVRNERIAMVVLDYVSFGRLSARDLKRSVQRDFGQHFFIAIGCASPSGIKREVKEDLSRMFGSRPVLSNDYALTLNESLEILTRERCHVGQQEDQGTA